MSMPVTLASPWAKTVQGLTPTAAVINSASPKPKMVKPSTKNTKETKGGLSDCVFFALQKRMGTDLIFKNDNENAMSTSGSAPNIGFCTGNDSGILCL